MQIAIISPNQNAYSETFIQAHKNLLKGTIHYLYGSFIPSVSDYTGKKLIPKTLGKKIWFQVLYRFKNHGLTKAQYALKRYLKKHHIQCVLAEYGITGANVYPVCNQLQIPLIVNFFGYDASVSEVLKEYKTAYRKMFSEARFITGVSRSMITKLQQLGADKDKLIYNACGPNEKFLEFERKNTKSKLFFGLGRFVNKKAPYYTIIAFSKVLKKIPDARLVIGGDGPLLDVCINLSLYLGVREHIDFPGVITPEEERRYLSEAVAFVQHSITALNGDMEGTPVAVLEASAAGLPVISTFHAGIPDVIIHEKTGLLCKEHDYEKMAEHMSWIIENRGKAIQMGKEGRKNVKENFSMKAHINKLNELIEKATDV